MRLVLIDGHAILHRAFHAYPPLTTSKGELIGAVYGFTNILLTVLARLHPEFVACAFDKKGPTFRHKKFAAYKAHRPEMDVDLSGQIPRVHQVVEALNIPIFEVEGYEADDVIGTLALQAGKWEVRNEKCENEMGNVIDESGESKCQKIALQKSKKSHLSPLTSNLEVIIVTGDQDALQLIDNHTKVYMPARGKVPERVYDRKAVLEKYGLEPTQIADLKALAGDPSDGIPGVAGIGPKTAKDLLARFSTVEGIYKHFDDLPKTLRKKLEKGKNEAFLSKELAKIDLDMPIKLSLRACRLTDYQKKKVLRLFRQLEFKSLIKKLPGEGREGEEGKKGKQMGLF